MKASIFEPLELKTLAFYRYLPQSVLEEKIERLESRIDELEDKVYQIDTALDVCYGYMAGDFTRFVEALPWILGATYRSEPTYIENSHDQIARFVDAENLGLDSFSNCRSNLTTCIKNINSEIDVLRRNMGHLIEIAEDDDRPLPIPRDFFVERNYAEGDPIIGYCKADERKYLHIGPLWAAIIVHPMVDLWVMSVRPLADAEYAKFGLGLEILRGRQTSPYLSYAWALSLETYLFYQEHPEAVAEHLVAFKKFNGSEPKSLLALQEHFS